MVVVQFATIDSFNMVEMLKTVFTFQDNETTSASNILKCIFRSLFNKLHW